MEFTKIRIPQLLLFLLLMGSCAEPNSPKVEEEYTYGPKINIETNKSIGVTISGCDFEKSDENGLVLYQSKVENGDLKLLIGSKLSCDYKNGAYLKEIENTSQKLEVQIFQKGERLSNECMCFFYYEISVKNKTEIPDEIQVGSMKISNDLRASTSEAELHRIVKEIKSNN